MRSARRRLMVSPNPVPPKRRVVLASCCVKGSKIASTRSGSTPMPVSCTAISTRSCFNFSRIDEPLLAELEALVARAVPRHGELIEAALNARRRS